MKKAEKICQERNIKFTKLRKKVLELILASHQPIKAYEILERLKQEEHIGQPITVYRILDFLLENGLVHKLESQNAFLACSHPSELHNCYFLICTGCKNIEEICKSSFFNELYLLAKETNFTIQKFTLEIQGLCSNCS